MDKVQKLSNSEPEIYLAARRHIPDGGVLHTENLKSNEPEVLYPFRRKSAGDKLSKLFPVNW
jgi:hypothetical protein